MKYNSGSNTDALTLDQNLEYIAHSLLVGEGTSPELQEYLDTFDFYLFQIINPDGMCREHIADLLFKVPSDQKLNKCQASTIPRTSTDYGAKTDKSSMKQVAASASTQTVTGQPFGMQPRAGLRTHARTCTRAPNPHKPPRLRRK